MITVTIRNQIDQIWNEFWTGGGVDRLFALIDRVRRKAIAA